MEREWRKWHSVLKNLQEDIRLEVVLAELLEDGRMKEDEFFTLPNGGFHRSVSEDIKEVFPPSGTALDLDRATFEVNRPGIYDGLPEAFFHQKKMGKPTNNVSDIKAEIARNNEVEKEARRFFAPLDHELIQTRWWIERNERRMTSHLLNMQDKRGLKKFWQIPDFFDLEEQGKLVMLLPLAFRIAGDLNAAAEAMSIVLEIDVAIYKEKQQHQIDEEPDLLDLGQCQLGIHTVLSGHDVVDNGNLVIELGPMSRTEAASYSMEQDGYIKLNYLAEYFIPADMGYSLNILVEGKDQNLQLDKDSGLTRLGVTTYLN